MTTSTANFLAADFFEARESKKFYRWNYGVFFETNSENKSCGTLTALYQILRILTLVFDLVLALALESIERWTQRFYE